MAKGIKREFFGRIADALTSARAKKTEPEHIIFRRPFLINAFHSVIPTDWNADLIEKGTHPEGQLSSHERSLANDDVAKSADVFLGIAGFKSLDMLCLIGSKKPSRRYTKAILCDINRKQVEAMRDVLSYIEKYDNPTDFIRAFATQYPNHMKPLGEHDPGYEKYDALPAEEKDQFFNAYGNSYTPPPTADALRSWCLKEKKEIPYSWLQPSNYEYIRGLVRHGDIAVSAVDLRDNGLVDAIKNQLKKEKRRVGHCYVSSVMDFMDPYAKTDYYSKGESLGDIKRFYENLLGLADDHCKFIVSASSSAEVSPILHNYHLERLLRSDVEKKYRDLPTTEPENSEKTYSILFNTGDQVWRLAEFEAPNGSHYFRIFSETKPHDMVKLCGQIDIINDIIQSLQGSKKRKRMARADFVNEESISSSPEAKFFAQQAQEPLDNRHMLSCKPFTLQAARGQDVYDTIEELVKSIKDAMQRKAYGAQAGDDKPPLEVVVKRVQLGSMQKAQMPPPAQKGPPGPGLFG